MRRAPSLSVARLAVLSLVLAWPLHAEAQAYPGAPTPPPPMAPPAPMDPSGQPAPTYQDATQARLNEAESEDSGRGFELFWLRGEVGGAYTDMAQFSSETLQIEKTKAGGPFFGLGAGIRLVVLTAGARIRYNALSSYNLWQVNGEIGLKFPIRSIDLLVGVHGGWSFVGSLGDAGLATSSGVPDAQDRVSVRGPNAGVDLAVDYYVSPTFSVGVGAFGDALFLNRPPIEKPPGLTPEQEAAIANDPLYQKSGTSAGLQLGAALRLGLHFGL